MDAMNEETLEARSEAKWPSVNQEVVPLVDALIRDALALRVDVRQGPLGETLIDCGVRVTGGGHTSQIYAIRQAIAKSIVRLSNLLPSYTCFTVTDRHTRRSHTTKNSSTRTPRTS